RKLRDGGGAAWRRLGAARLPPHLRLLRRLLHHRGKLPVAARLATPTLCDRHHKARECAPPTGVPLAL
ncbi:MAG: hypothetical protein ACXVDA_24390, partial [Ktedonobacterales bacterium]